MRFSELKKIKNISIQKDYTEKPLSQQKEVFKETQSTQPKSDLNSPSDVSSDIKFDSKVGVDNQDTTNNVITENNFSLNSKAEPERKNFFEEDEYEKVKILYGTLLNRFEKVVSLVREVSYTVAFDEIVYISSVIEDELENRYFPLFLRYITPNNYLISHSVNVAFLSGGIGKLLGFDKDIVRKLIVSGLVFDLGMLNYRYLYTQERRLSSDEKKIIEGHVKDGVEIAEKIFVFDRELKDFVVSAILDSHERCDGSGYFNKVCDEISLTSQIIALSDFYEAMTHPRTWRNAFEESFVINELSQRYKKLFNARVFKGLVLLLGIYPPKSLVKLSSGEIAEVVFVNRQRITRPFVKIIADSSYNLSDEYYLDLEDYPFTSIDAYVSYNELVLKNPDLKRQKDMERLWIEW